MNIKFYSIIFFLSGYLFSSDNSNAQNYTVAGVSVSFISRLESEPDLNGIQRDTFVQAEGNQVQEALEMIQNNENILNNLHGAESASVEINHQSNEAYIVITYSNGKDYLDKLY